MIRFCTLFSSSSGNSIYISDGRTNILVDAGVSASKIVNSLGELGVCPESIDAILVTHEHSDHVSGIGVLTRKYGIPVYANDSTILGFSHGGSAPIPECVKSLTSGEETAIGSLVVRPFRTPHDSRESVGYTVTSGDVKIAVATDTGCVTKPLLTALAGSYAVLIEANHDETMVKEGMYPYPLKRRILSDSGHLSNDNCAWLATQLALWGTKHIAIGHLSENNNTPEKAYDAVHKRLSENGFKVGEDVFLTVAQSNKITEII